MNPRDPEPRSALFTDVRHDAEIELGREDGDCVLSALDYHEAVLKLVAIAEAAEVFCRSTTVFRLRKESREEFETMALALIEAGAFRG